MGLAQAGITDQQHGLGRRNIVALRQSDDLLLIHAWNCRKIKVGQITHHRKAGGPHEPLEAVLLACEDFLFDQGEEKLFVAGLRTGGIVGETPVLLAKGRQTELL